MEQNIAIISLEKYEELIESKYLVDELRKYIDKLKLERADLKEAFLEAEIDDFKIRNYGLDEITNLGDIYFCLRDKFELLRFFTKEELVDFIKRKKAEIEKEDK